MPGPRVELLFTGSDQGATATAVGVQEAVEGLAEGAERANQSFSAGLGATVLEFQRVDQSVQQLTADYSAGLLKQEEWEQGLAAARAEAIALRQATGDLSNKELRAFGGVLDKTANVSGQATVKLDVLNGGMRQLAQQAAGVQGPIGAVISQILQLAGGSTLVVGAAAGIGIVALAWRAITAEARKAEKAQQDAIDRLLKLREGRRGPEVQQTEDVALLRERLTNITVALAAAEQARHRALTAANPSVLIEAESDLNKLLEERRTILDSINEPAKVKLARERTEREKAYEDAVRAVTNRIATLAIQVDHVGKSRDELTDALLRQELAQRHLSQAEIDDLVVKERQARALDDELAQRQAIEALIRSTRPTVIAPDGGTDLRGTQAPSGKPPAAPGTGTTDVELLTQAELFAHQMVDSFDLSIGMVDDLAKSLDNLASGSLAALGGAFETVFDAIISGGKVSGDQMVKGLLGAISKAAIHEGAFYFARGVAALAGAIFPVPNPANAVSAAQYFQAAALMGGVGLVAGGAASAIGGGEVSGTLAPDRFRDTARSVQEDRASGTIAIQGDWWPGDPRFVDQLAIAVNEMIDRGITDVRIIPAGGGEG